MREIYGLTLSPSSSYLGVYERVGFAKYNDKNARIAIDSISRFADPTRRQTLILVSCLNFETQERTHKTWGHTGTLGFYVWYLILNFGMLKKARNCLILMTCDLM
jgi:hypothetical protein